MATPSSTERVSGTLLLAVLLSQLPQAAVGVLSIFIVRGLLEINARAIIYSG